MANYSTISHRDLGRLISEYNLGDHTEVSNMRGGAANTSFVLRTPTDKYIFTVCDAKQLSDVESLVQLLILLEQEDFPTNRIVLRSNGRPILIFKDKPAILKTYVDGDVYHDMTPAMLEQTGEAIAQLHGITPPNYLPESFPYGLQCFSELFSQESEFAGWIRGKAQLLIEGISPDLPRGLIHGDVFYDNTIFDKGVLAGIIDFEEACHYFKVFDLGMCAVGTCSDKGKLSLPKVHSLINGYQHTRKLEPEEKASLQLFAEYGAIATAFWRYQQYNIANPNPAMANRYLEMKNLADNIHAIPRDEFVKKL
jgi:homoserine kinase type II